MVGPEMSHAAALALVLLPASASSQAEARQGPRPVDFARDVRPILEERCSGCHGAKRQRGKLRLDRRTPQPDFLVAGDAGASELYRRITSADPEERMPAEGEPLAAGEIALLARWIEEGASWPADPSAELERADTHWAYVAPARGPVPPDPFAGWARGPLDRFVAQRLAEQGLAPSSESDRATLLRRASLDLTGLPPTPEEVDAFVADPSPRAYEERLERLLASPHYGEHQARAWLDLARYADTDGYEKDERRTVWRWRDWVIEAFNRDLSFDRFTIEQLAGDLLPDATAETVLATGFHRNTMTNKEGGTDPEEFRVAAVKDRVDTTATVWLGTTLACAQCHDHKYDPLTQADYYRFLAFFDGTEDVGNSNAPEVRAPRAADVAREAQLRPEKSRLESALASPGDEVARERARWEAAWREHARGWHRLVPRSARCDRGAELAIRADGSVLASGTLPDTDLYAVELAPAAEPIAALRLEVLADPSLPESGPGRRSHRNFVLNELTLEQATAAGAWCPVRPRTARADHEQHGGRDWPAAAAIDGDASSGWAIAGGEGQSHVLVLELAQPLAAGTSLRLRLEQDYGSGHLIGCFAVSGSPERPPELDPVPAPALASALEAGAARPAGDEAQLAGWYLERAPALADERARLAAIERELATIPTALVMRERIEPRSTHVMVKGNFLAPGSEVQPGTPAVLAPLEPRDPARRPDRLDLARWLVSPANPLTARVFVNRTWERLFGRGLVATSQDFGTQGDSPTHPELLDWLALELVESGWSVKELLRSILASATYRQAARVTPELLARDPDNRWLARGPRLRVDAETVRDVALAASGLLCAEIGGPSVFPPQPEGIWMMTYSDDRWATSEGCDRHRRGLYTFLRRTSPYPTFVTFDATSREVACPRRARTNTPLQALATLNDPAFVECALALAGRMIKEGGEQPEARAARGFRLCVAREPAAGELAVLLELYRAQRADYAARPAEAEALAGERARAQALDPVELAAWTVVANALLNLDETLTKG